MVCGRLPRRHKVKRVFWVQEDVVRMVVRAGDMRAESMKIYKSHVHRHCSPLLDCFLCSICDVALKKLQSASWQTLAAASKAQKGMWFFALRHPSESGHSKCM